MIPLILGAAAMGAGAVGVKKGSEGIGNMKQAKEIGERAQKRYEDAVKDLQEYWEGTNKLAEEYGKFQLEIMIHTIRRFVDFIERNIGKAKQTEKEFLEGLDGISIPQIKEYKTTTK
ncbi:MAG: glycosyltransferase family 90 protein [Rivularia sp. ALOHA_DT_140]|nr:glycosyltransferase family 90 protein [Rivularia sp. ALOHA_DT_140]